MSYLLENNERYALKLLVERPELLARINPWWFFDDTAKHVAWSIYNANKNAVEWNTIHDITDAEKHDKNMVDRYLDIDLPDPKILDDIVDYFILCSQVFEIAEKDLEKNVLSQKEVKTLRAISEKLKQYKWNDKVIEYVREMYIKVTDDWKSKKDRRLAILKQNELKLLNR